MVMNKRTQLPTPSRQLGPVLALTELLTLHPELPPLNWTVTEHGVLIGHGYDFDGSDMAATLAAYAEILGGELGEPHHYQVKGAARASRHLRVVFQDVQVDVTVHAGAETFPELLALSEVAA
jgi:hypothetical protein